jgi:DNA-directed RNA polymerase alpha subunit
MHRDEPEKEKPMLWRGFQKPKRLAVDTETLTEKYGKFSAQPFERGFGTTIGNALRRTLLSSIEGAAVTAVRIEGVLHEFQSITGVVEDATDIILNLKQIPFKLNGEGPKALYLRADAAGVITSGMIEADGDVEILDKDVYICTVSEGGKIDMEMRLKRGRGYISADKNFDATSASASSRSTPSTRRCARSTTSSKRRVSVRSPTTTSSRSRSGPTARSSRPTRSAFRPSC